MTSELVYGRRPVRELLRGPREVLELWATERALRAEPWLKDAPVRVQRRPERELNAAVGTTDHQGVLARAVEVHQETLQHLRPNAFTKTYSPAGRVSVAAASTASTLRVAG